MNFSKKQWRTQQRGAGLLEVLVAMLVLGIGVLGIAALQSIALKNSGGSASTTNATIQVYAMLDILRAADATQLANYNTGGYIENETATSAAIGTKEGWLNSLKTTVAPDAKGLIRCENSNPATCTVGVQWDNSRAKGGDAAQTVEATSQI